MAGITDTGNFSISSDPPQHLMPSPIITPFNGALLRRANQVTFLVPNHLIWSTHSLWTEETQRLITSPLRVTLTYSIVPNFFSTQSDTTYGSAKMQGAILSTNLSPTGPESCFSPSRRRRNYPPFSQNHHLLLHEIFQKACAIPHLSIYFNMFSLSSFFLVCHLLPPHQLQNLEKL